MCFSSHYYNSRLRSGYTLLMQRTFKQVLLNPHAYKKNIGCFFFFSPSMKLFRGNVTHLYLCKAAQAAAPFRGFLFTKTKVHCVSWVKIMSLVEFRMLFLVIILIQLTALALAARFILHPLAAEVF